MTSLLYEVKKEIAWIRFNKPEILNAFDAEECRHFVKVLKEATEDKNVKAIILSSIGPAFSAEAYRFFSSEGLSIFISGGTFQRMKTLFAILSGEDPSST